MHKFHTNTRTKYVRFPTGKGGQDVDSSVKAGEALATPANEARKQVLYELISGASGFGLAAFMAAQRTPAPPGVPRAHCAPR